MILWTVGWVASQFHGRLVSYQLHGVNSGQFCEQLVGQLASSFHSLSVSCSIVFQCPVPQSLSVLFHCLSVSCSIVFQCRVNCMMSAQDNSVDRKCACDSSDRQGRSLWVVSQHAGPVSKVQLRSRLGRLMDCFSVLPTLSSACVVCLDLLKFVHGMHTDHGTH